MVLVQFQLNYSQYGGITADVRKEQGMVIYFTVLNCFIDAKLSKLRLRLSISCQSSLTIPCILSVVLLEQKVLVSTSLC